MASETAEFGCFEVGFGVALVDGGTQRPPWVVGLGRALELILTGPALDAEAREWGLVNRLAPEGEALELAMLSWISTGDLWTDWAAVYDRLGESLETGLQIETRHGARAHETAMDGADRFASGEGRGGEGVKDPQA